MNLRVHVPIPGDLSGVKSDTIVQLDIISREFSCVYLTFYEAAESAVIL